MGVTKETKVLSPSSKELECSEEHRGQEVSDIWEVRVIKWLTI